MTSITEQSNTLSSSIDKCTVSQILDVLESVDNEMFTNEPNKLFHSDKHIQNMIIKCCEAMSKLIGDVLYDYDKNNVIVFAGCGTSGRLSYFCAKNYNQCLSQIWKNELGRETDNEYPIELFKYLLAGGHQALVKAVESAEDSATGAIQDLNKLMDSMSETLNKKQTKVVYVGITCGLSAPYIAGQLFHNIQKVSQQPKSKDASVVCSILLGFNPVERARKTPIEHWDPYNNGETINFYKIAKQFEALACSNNDKNSDQFIILNPIVGPEAITGSTRMKGGSATKFLLDTIFASAVLTELKNRINEPLNEIIYKLLNGFHQTVSYTYQFADHHSKIAQLIDHCASTLCANGSIYYLGSGNAGMVGFIDASECAPTYGAKATDVRGYIVNGWKSVFGPKKYQHVYPKMEENGPDFQISIQDFEKDVLPKLTTNDTVIFLHIDSADQDFEELDQLYKLADHIIKEHKSVHVSWISISAIDPTKACMFPIFSNDVKDNESTARARQDHLNDRVNHVLIRIPYLSLIPSLNGFAELSLKLVLNAITTGAHIMKGTVFGNRMINLRVSNNKLFYRALGIIADIMKVDNNVARECLLKSIYRVDDIESFEKNPISTHIRVAVETDRVMPVALLLAASARNGKISTIQEALKLLQKEPIIRNAIAKLNATVTTNIQ
jgi:N-acetylmuramic acid 6-phosphate (MurNAc-6-P) etherase